MSHFLVSMHALFADDFDLFATVAPGSSAEPAKELRIPTIGVTPVDQGLDDLGQKDQVFQELLRRFHANSR
jgi:hypothetical protein